MLSSAKSRKVEVIPQGRGTPEPRARAAGTKRCRKPGQGYDRKLFDVQFTLQTANCHISDRVLYKSGFYIGAIIQAYTLRISGMGLGVRMRLRRCSR